MKKLLSNPKHLIDMAILCCLISMACMIALGVSAYIRTNAPQNEAIAPVYTASWYGKAYEGKPTASGALFDPKSLTCASWDYPFGTMLAITHKCPDHEERTAFPKVNDRGPNKRLYAQGRIIDLSRQVFSRLCELDTGVIEIKIMEFDDIPLRVTNIR